MDNSSSRSSNVNHQTRGSKPGRGRGRRSQGGRVFYNSSGNSRREPSDVGSSDYDRRHRASESGEYGSVHGGYSDPYNGSRTGVEWGRGGGGRVFHNTSVYSRREPSDVGSSDYERKHRASESSEDGSVHSGNSGYRPGMGRGRGRGGNVFQNTSGNSRMMPSDVGSSDYERRHRAFESGEYGSVHGGNSNPYSGSRPDMERGRGRGGGVVQNTCNNSRRTPSDVGSSDYERRHRDSDSGVDDSVHGDNSGLTRNPGKGRPRGHILTGGRHRGQPRRGQRGKGRGSKVRRRGCKNKEKVPSLMSMDTSSDVNTDGDVIFSTLLKEFDGRATLEVLQKSLPMYSESEFYRFFSPMKSDAMFLLFKNPEHLNKSIVVIYHPRLKLCFQYPTSGGCGKTACQHVHLCKEFLAGNCRISCGLSHDTGSDHNKTIMKRLKLNTYSCSEQCIIIKSSNPKVCIAYNSEMGCKHYSCPDVHICAEDISEKEGCGGCLYNHNIFTCKKTLEKYVTSMGRSKDDFLKKLLIVAEGNVKVGTTYSRSRSLDAVTLEDDVDSGKEINKDEKEIVNGKATLSEVDLSTVTYSRSRTLDADIYVDDVDSRGEIEIDEEEIVQALLHEFDGKATLNDLVNRFAAAFQGVDVVDVVEWYKQQDQLKVFVHRDDLNLSVVIAFMKRLKLCLNRNCRSSSCGALHICTDFILGDCKARNCKLNHDVRSKHNDRILDQNRLPAEAYDKRAVRKLLYYSRIKCCLKYVQGDKCEEEALGVCPDIHVCPRFIQGKCMTPDVACSRGHDLTEDKCMKTLKQYELGHLTAEKAKKMVIVVKNLRIKPAVIQIHESDTFICEKHIRKECDQGSWCPHHHYSLPYLWQVQYQGNWINLQEENQKVEEAYCDVYLSTVEMSIGEIFPMVSVQLDFEAFRCMTSDGTFQGDIRRLTTESYIDDSNSSHFTTNWLWFWRNDNSTWIEYGEEAEPPFQDVLEASLSKGLKTYHFKHDGQKYRIDLDKDNLRQTNVNFGTERVIRRRPMLVDGMDIVLQTIPRRPILHYNSKDLPKDWQPMDTQTPEAYEKIELAKTNPDYRGVEAAFKKSLDANYKIRGIFRIQNLTHWNNYKRKKNTMCKLYNDDEVEVDEKQLFHGTKDHTIEYICRQNFDPRMHDGRGVYFSRNAKYSDSHTGHSHIRCMFYANVLTGRKTEGKGDMRRPPPVDPKKPSGELYASCVDNLYPPSIFVIFERDQCYPEYLIEYKYTPPPVVPATRTPNVFSATPRVNQFSTTYSTSGTFSSTLYSSPHTSVGSPSSLDSSAPHSSVSHSRPSPSVSSPSSSYSKSQTSYNSSQFPPKSDRKPTKQETKDCIIL